MLFARAPPLIAATADAMPFTPPPLLAFAIRRFHDIDDASPRHLSPPHIFAADSRRCHISHNSRVSFRHITYARDYCLHYRATLTPRRRRRYATPLFRHA